MLASLGLALTVGCAPRAASTRASTLVVWAWERPEDLRFLPPGVEIAALTGFIEISGPRTVIRGRLHPLRAQAGQVTTAVVHVEIDPRRPFEWSEAREAEVAAAILDLGGAAWARRLQVDFEVRASQRPILLGVLRRVRDGLKPGVVLSMTALASWCETEGWLAEAPVDEIAPMLFRMGRGGVPIREKLGAGGDFRNARCRDALAISTDAPLPGAPAGRRVYLFNPRSWSAADFAAIEERVRAWRAVR